MPSFDYFCQQMHNNVVMMPALKVLNRHPSMNTNILLFSCWFAFSGQGRLRQKDFRLLRRTIATWHDKVISPLQQMPTLSDSVTDELQKTLSLAQHIEQRLLTDTIMVVGNSQQKDQLKLKNVFRNIKLYCDYLHLTLKESGWQAIYTLLQELFPAIPAQQIHAWCRSNMIAKHAASQLHMDFI